MDKKSFFIPWKNDFSFGEKNIAVKLNHSYKHHQFYFNSNSNRPYISLVNDNSIPKAFIDAVIKKDFDDAMSYISRFNIFVDRETIINDFNKVKSYNYIPVYKNFCKNKKVNSVMVSENDKKVILHFYLINEPDFFGNWKIYRIEKESITGNFERKKLWIKF